jgi:hypothetical protein
MFEAQKSSVLTVDRGLSFVVESGHQSERRAAVPQLQAQKANLSEATGALVYVGTVPICGSNG